MFPIPPSTTYTRIMMDMLYPKFLGRAVRVVRLWAYSTPAIPASPAEMENASSLYLVILIPMDSAAIRLSRIAMMARPVREFTRFMTMNRVISTRITPMVKVAAWGVPVMPWAPFIRISPPSPSFKDMESLKEIWKPDASRPR